MNTINYIGMLLLSYLSLYAASRSVKAHLKYKNFQIAFDTFRPGSYPAATKSWIKMIVWFSICVLSIILVFKATP